MASAGFYYVAGGEIIDRHNARPGAPGGKQLVLAIVEGQRQHAQHYIVGFQPQIMGHADRAEPEIGMAQHHALGPAGGAAGVKDRRKIVRIGGARCKRAAQGLGPCPDIRFLDQLASCRNIAFAQAGKAGGIAQQQAGATIGQNMRDLRMFEQRIDRHMHQPCPCRSQREQAGQLALGRPACHPRAPFRDMLRQPCGEQRDTLP